MNDYEDIINLPHYVSKTHPPMSPLSRAAQFSPFAALTGYDEEIDETARLTDCKLSLSEEKQAQLNNILLYLNDNIKLMPEISVQYFIKDEKKEGGMYVTLTGTLRRIDFNNRILIFTDSSTVDFDDVYSLDIKGNAL